MTAHADSRCNTRKLLARSLKRRVAEVRPPPSPQDMARAIFAHAEQRRASELSATRLH